MMIAIVEFFFSNAIVEIVVDMDFVPKANDAGIKRPFWFCGPAHYVFWSCPTMITRHFQLGPYDIRSSPSAGVS